MADASELLWKKDAEAFGWTLPPAAAWWLRVPIVRHARALVAAYRVDAHERMWRSLGAIPNGYDRWVVYAIGRGWC